MPFPGSAQNAWRATAVRLAHYVPKRFRIVLGVNSSPMGAASFVEPLDLIPFELLHSLRTDNVSAADAPEAIMSAQPQLWVGVTL